jgi:hypothetical protein
MKRRVALTLSSLPRLAVIAFIAIASVNAYALEINDLTTASTSSLEQQSLNTSLPTKALSFEQITQRYIDNPVVIGESRFKVMFFKVYDAKLAVSKLLSNKQQNNEQAQNEGTYKEWKQDTPFALSLTYLRDFEGEDIASRSVDEMRDIGYTDEVLLAKWFEQMRSVFPNVKEGENITGVFDKNKHTHFYHEGKLIGSIDDKMFGESFFGIWLNEKTSEPKMRKQLLGL